MAQLANIGRDFDIASPRHEDREGGQLLHSDLLAYNTLAETDFIASATNCITVFLTLQ